MEDSAPRAQDILPVLPPPAPGGPPPAMMAPPPPSGPPPSLPMNRLELKRGAETLSPPAPPSTPVLKQRRTSGDLDQKTCLDIRCHDGSEVCDADADSESDSDSSGSSTSDIEAVETTNLANCISAPACDSQILSAAGSAGEGETGESSYERAPPSARWVWDRLLQQDAHRVDAEDLSAAHSAKVLEGRALRALHALSVDAGGSTGGG